VLDPRSFSLKSESRLIGSNLRRVLLSYPPTHAAVVLS
jgi:hypothetical protein